jgi:hypothetical protein
MHSWPKKITAVLLLLLFLEKAEFRLLIHAHFHEYATTSTDSKNAPGLPVVTQLGCDCLDDFFVPISPASEIRVAVPLTPFCDRYTTHDTSFNYSISSVSSLLRGPPDFA